jgi:hypothetical protein
MKKRKEWPMKILLLMSKHLTYIFGSVELRKNGRPKTCK